MRVTRMNGQAPLTYNNSKNKTNSKPTFNGNISINVEKPENIAVVIKYLTYRLNDSKIGYVLESAKNKLSNKITVPPVHDVKAGCIAREVGSYEEVKNIATINFEK